MKDIKWQYGQVGIVVGTGKGEAAHMISRCKDILEIKDARGYPTGHYKYPINWDYNTKTEFSINTVEFKAFPALNKHIDAIRSQPNMRMIIGDEVAFFTDVDQQKIRDAFEHYIGGSEAIIALITTAGDAPQGFAYEIETEDPSIYRKHLLDYHAGLEVHPESMTSLYRKPDIDSIKHLPSFARNFQGKWGHGIGDIFDTNTINLISSENYDFPVNIRGLPNVLAIDPAFGEQRNKLSSKFAGLGMYVLNGVAYTRSYFELEEPTDKEGNERIQQEIDQYGYTNLVIDGQWSGIIRHFSSVIHTTGIPFNEYSLKMTDNASQQVKDMKVRIHPTHEALPKQLRPIRRNNEGKPDKKRFRYDLGDCFHMDLWHLFGTSQDYSIFPLN